MVSPHVARPPPHVARPSCMQAPTASMRRCKWHVHARPRWCLHASSKMCHIRLRYDRKRAQHTVQVEQAKHSFVQAPLVLYVNITQTEMSDRYHRCHRCYRGHRWCLEILLSVPHACVPHGCVRRTSGCVSCASSCIRSSVPCPTLRTLSHRFAACSSPALAMPTRLFQCLTYLLIDVRHAAELSFQHPSLPCRGAPSALPTLCLPAHPLPATPCLPPVPTPLLFSSMC